MYFPENLWYSSNLKFHVQIENNTILSGFFYCWPVGNFIFLTRVVGLIPVVAANNCLK